ncbi:hypothetical protein [Micromonospora sp. NPDC000668]|uniref:hypothetical protein n=1 Tax=Micromonospora sp. NPDC000668 TaxID=3364219 RepID=UPI00368CFF5E
MRQPGVDLPGGVHRRPAGRRLGEERGGPGDQQVSVRGGGGSSPPGYADRRPDRVQLEDPLRRAGYGHQVGALGVPLGELPDGRNRAVHLGQRRRRPDEVVGQRSRGGHRHRAEQRPARRGVYRRAHRRAAVDHPDELLVTGEWHVPGEPVRDQREQYVVQDRLAAQPGVGCGGEGREILGQTLHGRDSAHRSARRQPE